MDMEEDTQRTPSRSGDMKPDGAKKTENIETEGSTGAVDAPQMPPVLDERGSPDIEKRR
jgi:hypothetical protein